MLLRVKHFLSRVKTNLYKAAYIQDYNRFLESINFKNQLYIFDLDNTLADTYPYFKRKDKETMYKFLPAHKNMLKLASEIFYSDIPGLVLTARDYRYKSATRYWLEKNIPNTKVPLFIVPSANDKIKYLSMALDRIEKVVYYDDLSYNHENGVVKFYNDEINIVKQLSVEYYGYEDINKINSD